MMEQGFNYPAVLDKFKHGFKTNLKKGVMTNQDAVLLILNANSGTMKRATIVDALLRWRFGSVKYELRQERRYVGANHPGANKHGILTRKVMKPAMGFTYLFNGRPWSGYGAGGDSVDSRGRLMNR